MVRRSSGKSFTLLLQQMYRNKTFIKFSSLIECNYFETTFEKVHIKLLPDGTLIFYLNNISAFLISLEIIYIKNYSKFSVCPFVKEFNQVQVKTCLYNLNYEIIDTFKTNFL